MSSKTYVFFNVHETFLQSYRGNRPQIITNDHETLMIAIACEMKTAFGLAHDVLPSKTKPILGIHTNDVSNRMLQEKMIQAELLVPVTRSMETTNGIPMGDILTPKAFYQNASSISKACPWTQQDRFRYMDDVLRSTFRENQEAGSYKTKSKQQSNKTKISKPQPPIATNKRVQVGKTKRVVYEGPRGGRYILRHGQYVPLSSIR